MSGRERRVEIRQGKAGSSQAGKGRWSVRERQMVKQELEGSQAGKGRWSGRDRQVVRHENAGG